MTTCPFLYYPGCTQQKYVSTSLVTCVTLCKTLLSWISYMPFQSYKCLFVLQSIPYQPQTQGHEHLAMLIRGLKMRIWTSPYSLSSQAMQAFRISLLMHIYRQKTYGLSWVFHLVRYLCLQYKQYHLSRPHLPSIDSWFPTTEDKDEDIYVESSVDASSTNQHHLSASEFHTLILEQENNYHGFYNEGLDVIKTAAVSLAVDQCLQR
jgi:hypothetical protein